MEPYVHLHVHSQYSLLDGQAAIKELVNKASSDGMRGIALTDHGTMFGIKEFYNCIKKKNAPILAQEKELKAKINNLKEQDTLGDDEQQTLSELESELKTVQAQVFKPIMGCETYCARRGRALKDKNVPHPYYPNRSADNSGWHLILLAKNLQGYKNLIKMVSISFTEGFYGKPRIDKELLEKYHEGIIVSSACLGGEIAQHIMHGNIAEAEKSIEWFKGIFGDDYYLEVQRHKTDKPDGNTSVYEEQERVNGVILE